MRIYGTYCHVPAVGKQRASWAVQARPHTAIKFKRVFARVLQERSGAITVTDTPEVARDLLWFMDRYPMQPEDAACAEYLRKRAQYHVDTEAAIDNLMAGYRPPLGLREPALPPREHQEVVPHLVRATGRLMLGDPIGMGKTYSSALLLCDPQSLPAVVVTKPQLVIQWQRELARFFPWLDTHIVNSGRPYPMGPEVIQDTLPFDVAAAPKTRRGMTRTPDVLIMGYTMLYGWADVLTGSARTIIFDEIQELRTGPGTKKYTAAARIADEAAYRIGATATAVYNYGNEAYHVISILDPDVLGTEREFAREWCGDGFNGRVSDPAALGLYLREEGILLRRTQDRDKPIHIEQAVETDPAALARLAGDPTAMAKLVLDKTADRVERWRAAGELDLRMRHATGVAKAPYVAEFVRLLLESEEKILVFAWHHDVYGILEQRLKAFNPVLYTGRQTTREKDRNVERFVHGDARVMLMSLRAGVGLDGLQQACNVAVLAELDWSPAVMFEQCIGRLDREGQQHPVIAYFMLADEGSDPPMAEVIDIKRRQSEPIMDPSAELFEMASDAGVDRIKMLAADVLRRRGIELPADTQPAGLVP